MVEDRVISESSDGIPTTAMLTQLPYQLLKRTQAQLELARRVTALLRCSNAAPPAASTGASQAEASAAHDSIAAESTVAEVSAETSASISSGLSTVESPVEGQMVSTEEAQTSSTPITEGELPLASYDSLSASQVVPRLALMSREELFIIQRYERENRHRQTILNRCQQLLDEV